MARAGDGLARIVAAPPRRIKVLEKRGLIGSFYKVIPPPRDGFLTLPVL